MCAIMRNWGFSFGPVIDSMQWAWGRGIDKKKKRLGFECEKSNFFWRGMH